ncbi:MULTISPECIES: ABC transporter ATP-binding protein [Winogradskyella]|uniref:ABC transporter ATP-binding protein n=1 Tax=Winogradskyella TaxID=286104 RepID=UPI0015CB1E14|nr:MULTISPECIES: ABC transporter ATP-binding protein [Winogradskyella]QXP80035.1 ABC transporter ATP-binding protein [Winogradskyella sp. HaHa_3_26]
MKPAIKIENLSKQYRLGTVGTGSFAHDLNRWWYTVRGKEDPYLEIGETNDRANKGESDYVWALKDINFEVKPGEVLGIIGKNGAGKSTLLKLLSRVTRPTTGSIKARGRIASLLEVGTGFHPELTGRENVFLNGAIMGMNKQEIRSKFDEIVEFAGCERYIDTPVKRYSSGMYVRLAFAVAAHLEPEILIVDEVLAVGDAEFQKKAIGKMKDVSEGGKRTVIFVSHNMASIQKLCTRLVVMEKGTISYVGDVDKGIERYISAGTSNVNIDLKNRKDGVFKGRAKFTNLKITNQNDLEIDIVPVGSYVKFKLEIQSFEPLNKVGLRLLFLNSSGQILFLCNNLFSDSAFSISQNQVYTCHIPKFPLPEGQYYIQLSIFSENGMEYDLEFAKEIIVDYGKFFKSEKTPMLKEGVFVEHFFSKI